jgi:hypothetical protein
MTTFLFAPIQLATPVIDLLLAGTVTIAGAPVSIGILLTVPASVIWT